MTSLSTRPLSKEVRDRNPPQDTHPSILPPLSSSTDPIIITQDIMKIIGIKFHDDIKLAEKNLRLANGLFMALSEKSNGNPFSELYCCDKCTRKYSDILNKVKVLLVILYEHYKKAHEHLGFELYEEHANATSMNLLKIYDLVRDLTCATETAKYQ
jgi:hypothetical protein